MVTGVPVEAQELLIAPQPLHRYGEPEEVAEAVAFLLSDRASFILGVTLPIDGGAVATAHSYSPLLGPSAG